MEVLEQPNPSYSQLLQKKCRFYYQFTISTIASLTPFVAGCVIGSLSNVNMKIKGKELPFPTCDENITTLTNMASWSLILGPIIFTYFVNHFGRQKTMILLLLLPTVHYIILCVATDISMVIFAVCLACVPSLMIPAVAGVYISEVTAPHLRGAMNNITLIFFNLGVAFSNAISWPLTLSSSSFLLSIICISISLALLFLPESPYFFIRKGKPMHAKKVLKVLYNEEISNVELTRLNRHINQATEENPRFKDIFSRKKFRRSIFILCNLFFIKYASGALVITWFTPVLLTQAKYKYLSPYICQNIILIAGIFFSFLNTLFLRYFPIKTVGIISYTSTGISLILLSLYYFLIDIDCQFLVNLPDIFPFSLFLIFKISISMGLLVIPYIYLRELIQVQVLAYSTFIIDIFVPVNKAIIVFFFNYLRARFSYSAAFAFFFGCLLIGSIIFVIFTPETKDKVLEDAHKQLEKSDD